MTEPREALAALLMREGIAVENVASMGNADQWLPDYDLADRLIAAGVHLGDEGLRARVLAALDVLEDERNRAHTAGEHEYERGLEFMHNLLVAALATSAEGEDR